MKTPIITVPLVMALVTGMAAASFSDCGFAQQSTSAAAPPDFSQVEIKRTDLGHDTYMLAGQGGNMTAAIGSDAVFMVDSEFAPLHEKIKAAVATVSDSPVEYLVNTHFHGDHTGGDALFAKEGTVIVAHENVKKRLAEGTSNALTGATVAPMSGDALPTRTYTEQLVLMYGRRKVQIRHLPNAHTDGDSLAYFADANVLSTGDVVTVGGRYPNIDIANGGSIKGMIAGVDTLLHIAKRDTKIIPGHGPLLTRAQLVDYRAMLQKAEDGVAALVTEGKSEEDAVAAHPLAALDATAGAHQQGSDNFVKLIYRSLKSK